MLRHFRAHHFRNYSELSFNPGPALNVITGPNGSGKTSLLEAIYLLGSGRSFRTGRLGHLVSKDAAELTLFANAVDDRGHEHRLGLVRGRSGIRDLRVDVARPESLGALARLFPVQVFHPGTIQLVDGGSAVRRRYLDWLMFHVEQDFAIAWRNLTKAVSHRNRLLKTRSFTLSELKVWEEQVAQNSVKIQTFRQRHIPALQSTFAEILSRFEGPASTVTMSLSAGWPEGRSIEDVLAEHREQDVKRGFTSQGAHRADLLLDSETGSVKENLSRGQQKIVAYALVLAQVALFNQLTGRTCIVLIDDLGSELDSQNASRLIDAVLQRNNQIIVTALDDSVYQQVPTGIGSKTFHVEHGNLQPAETFEKGRPE